MKSRLGSSLGRRISIATALGRRVSIATVAAALAMLPSAAWSSTTESNFGATGPSVVEPVAVTSGEAAEFTVYLDRAGASDATKAVVWLPGYTDQAQSASGGWTMVAELDVDPASGVPGTRLEFSPVGEGAAGSELHFGITRVPAVPIWPLTLVFTRPGGDALVYADAAVGSESPDLPALQIRVQAATAAPSTAGVVIPSASAELQGTETKGSGGFGIVLGIAALAGVVGFTWAIRRDLADRRSAREASGE